jgi:hypothetical protein
MSSPFRLASRLLSSVRIPDEIPCPRICRPASTGTARPSSSLPRPLPGAQPRLDMYLKPMLDCMAWNALASAAVSVVGFAAAAGAALGMNDRLACEVSGGGSGTVWRRPKEPNPAVFSLGVEAPEGTASSSLAASRRADPIPDRPAPLGFDPSPPLATGSSGASSSSSLMRGDLRSGSSSSSLSSSDPELSLSPSLDSADPTSSSLRPSGASSSWMTVLFDTNAGALPISSLFWAAV